MIGIDCSHRLTPAQLTALYTFGVRWVGRYLTGSEALTEQEAHDIGAAGMYILSIFELNPTSATYFTAAQGHSDAMLARTNAHSAGMPTGAVIHATVDVDLIQQELPVLDVYVPAFADGLAPYRAGLYGSAPVLEFVTGPKIISRWQTLAWSDGILDPGADAFQLVPSAQIAGVTVDLDWCRTMTSLWAPPGLAVPMPADAQVATFRAKAIAAIEALS